jgi:hypothetical protein
MIIQITKYPSLTKWSSNILAWNGALLISWVWLPYIEDKVMHLSVWSGFVQSLFLFINIFRLNGAPI